MKFRLLSILSVCSVLVLAACGDKHLASTEPNLESPKIFKPCLRSLSDFEVTTTTLGGTGSGTFNVYRDRSNSADLYGIKKGKWLEAYASTVFRFFLGDHTQEVCFIIEGNDIHAAVKLDPTFLHADPYSGTTPPPFLPVGSGLGGIVAATMVLADVDLKGLGSNNSNLGVIKKNGRQIYYKIDSEQALMFDSSSDWFDLHRLASPTATDPYLQVLRLDSHMTPAYLSEIRNSGIQIARKSRKDLEAVLDFCETQLKVLPTYPAGYNLSNTGLFLHETAPATYKEAILRRFDLLRKVFGL